MKKPLPVALPPGVVTTTSLAPAVPAGVVARIDSFVSVETVAVAPPMVTTVSSWNPVLLRLVPVMVTLVPPAVGPLLGLIEITVGAAT